MKLLIVSDTHGRHMELEEAIEKEKPFDMLLHLGDVDRREDEIRKLVDCDVKIVSGNNDYFSKLPNDCEFNIGKTRFFMNHGHTHYVHMGTSEIEKEGRRRGADVVLFGHIHVPVLQESNGMTILCPGSIGHSRQRSVGQTYAVIEVDDTGVKCCEIRTI